MKKIVTQMKRTLSLVLAIMMVVTAVPQSANAVYGSDFNGIDEVSDKLSLDVAEESVPVIENEEEIAEDTIGNQQSEEVPEEAESQEDELNISEEELLEDGSDLEIEKESVLTYAAREPVPSASGYITDSFESFGGSNSFFGYKFSIKNEDEIINYINNYLQDDEELILGIHSGVVGGAGGTLNSLITDSDTNEVVHIDKLGETVPYLHIGNKSGLLKNGDGYFAIKISDYYESGKIFQEPYGGSASITPSYCFAILDKNTGEIVDAGTAAQPGNSNEKYRYRITGGIIRFNANGGAMPKSDVNNMELKGPNGAFTLQGFYYFYDEEEEKYGTSINSWDNIIPQKEGFVFIGWNDKADGTGNDFKYDYFEEAIDRVYYAQWAKGYTVPTTLVNDISIVSAKENDLRVKVKNSAGLDKIVLDKDDDLFLVYVIHSRDKLLFNDSNLWNGKYTMWNAVKINLENLEEYVDLPYNDWFINYSDEARADIIRDYEWPEDKGALLGRTIFRDLATANKQITVGYYYEVVKDKDGNRNSINPNKDISVKAGIMATKDISVSPAGDRYVTLTAENVDEESIVVSYDGKAIDQVEDGKYVVPYGKTLTVSVQANENCKIQKYQVNGANAVAWPVSGTINVPVKTDTDIKLNTVANLKVEIENVTPDSKGVYTIDNNKEYRVVAKRGTEDVKICSIKVGDGDEIRYSAKDEEYAFTATKKGTYEVLVKTGETSSENARIKINVLGSVSSIAVTGVAKNGTLKQPMYRDIEYPVVLNSGASYKDINVKFFEADSDGKITTTEAEATTTLSEDKKKLKISTFENDDYWVVVYDGAVNFSFRVKATAQTLPKPTLKVASTTHSNVTVTLTNPSALPKLNNGKKYVYKLSYSSKNKDAVFAEDSKEVEIGSELEAKKTMTVSTDVFDDEHAGKESIVVSAVIAIKDSTPSVESVASTATAATKGLAYETKLKLKQSVKVLYPGQEKVKIADAQFTNTTSFPTLEYDSGIGDAAYIVGNPTKITVEPTEDYKSLLVTVDDDCEPGKYTIVACAKRQSANANPSEASVIVEVKAGTVNYGISLPSDQVYKPAGKAATIKATAQMPSGVKGKTEWMVLPCDKNGINVGAAEASAKRIDKYVKISGGTVTVAKDYIQPVTGYDYFKIAVKGPDYKGTVRTFDGALYEVAYAPGTKNEWAAVSGPIKINTSGLDVGDIKLVMLDTNGDETDTEFTSGNKLLMNEMYVVRTSNNAEGNYTAKVTGLKVLDKAKGIYYADKPGAVSVTTTVNDGSKNTKKVNFVSEYKQIASATDVEVTVNYEEDDTEVTDGSISTDKYVYVSATLRNVEDTDLKHYNLVTSATNAKGVTYLVDGAYETAYTLNPAKSATEPTKVDFTVTDKTSKVSKTVTIQNSYYPNSLKTISAVQNGKLYANWKSDTENKAYINISGADTFVDDIGTIELSRNKAKYNDAYIKFFEKVTHGDVERETVKNKVVVKVPVTLDDEYDGANGSFNVFVTCFDKDGEPITKPISVSLTVDKMSVKTKGKYTAKTSFLFADNAKAGDSISLLQSDASKYAVLNSEKINGIYGAVVNGTENKFCTYFSLDDNKSLKLESAGAEALAAGTVRADDLKGYMNYTVQYGVYQDGTPAVEETKTVAITVTFVPSAESVEKVVLATLNGIKLDADKATKDYKACETLIMNEIKKALVAKFGSAAASKVKVEGVKGYYGHFYGTYDESNPTPNKEGLGAVNLKITGTDPSDVIGPKLYDVVIKKSVQNKMADAVQAVEREASWLSFYYRQTPEKWDELMDGIREDNADTPAVNEREEDLKTKILGLLNESVDTERFEVVWLDEDDLIDGTVKEYGCERPKTMMNTFEFMESTDSAMIHMSVHIRDLSKNDEEKGKYETNYTYGQIYGSSVSPSSRNLYFDEIQFTIEKYRDYYLIRGGGEDCILEFVGEIDDPYNFKVSKTGDPVDVKFEIYNVTWEYDDTWGYVKKKGDKITTRRVVYWKQYGGTGEVELKPTDGVYIIPASEITSDIYIYVY